MAQLLIRDGYRAVEDPSRANVLIVNTCGFIGPAKEESINVLRELAEGKRNNQILIAAGCLTQRYGSEVAVKVPGIDGVLGTRRWMDIVQVVRELRKGPHPEPLYHLPDEAKTVGTDEHEALRVSVAGASAYLKIADGCRRPCAFCAIPLIKGTAVSRPINTIVDEARRLRDMGVRELILIAQDTTDYGHDLGIKDGLAVLLEQLTDSVPDMDWIRVMYAYPGYVTDRLIEVMATRKQVLPYLDMPLQHAHPKTLIACAAHRILTGCIARWARCAPRSPILPSAPHSLLGIRARRKRNIRRWWILCRRSALTVWGRSNSPLSQAQPVSRWATRSLQK